MALLPLLPPPAALLARALPHGIPGLREQVLERTGLFGNAIDPNGTPGDPGLFGPDSVTWRLVGQPAMLLTGLRAALLQSLSAPIPTATDETGTFASDFTGRVARTGAFVAAQNLGSMDEVHRTARRVRAMHRVVKGAAGDGTDYDAGDFHQQAWVSMTFTDSVLASAEWFGIGRLSRADADAFVREQSTHGALLDPRVDLDGIFSDPEQRAALQAGTLPLPSIVDGELPVTYAELRAKMSAWTAELSITERTRVLIDATVSMAGLPPRQRTAARLFVLATLATVPDEWHELLAPKESRIDELLAVQAVRVPLALLQATVGAGGSVEVARARVAAG